jgi:hypothetical protein
MGAQFVRRASNFHFKVEPESEPRKFKVEPESEAWGTDGQERESSRQAEAGGSLLLAMAHASCMGGNANRGGSFVMDEHFVSAAVFRRSKATS